MPAERRPAHRRRRSPVVAVASLLVILAAAGCSGSEPTPAEARRDRVETRLRASFSGAQTDCILERADADLLRALDRTRDLDPDAAALATWSDVLVGCITDPDGTSTTSTTPAAPAASSTTTTGVGSLDPEVPPTSR